MFAKHGLKTNKQTHILFNLLTETLSLLPACFWDQSILNNRLLFHILLVWWEGSSTAGYLWFHVILPRAIFIIVFIWFLSNNRRVLDLFFYANCGIKSLAKVISRGYNQLKVKKILDLQHINTSTHQQLNMAFRRSSQSSSSSSRRSPICGALPPARGPTHPNCSPQSLTSPSLPSSSPSLSLSSSSLTLNTNIHTLKPSYQEELHNHLCWLQLMLSMGRGCLCMCPC